MNQVFLTGRIQNIFPDTIYISLNNNNCIPLSIKQGIYNGIVEAHCQSGDFIGVKGEVVNYNGVVQIAVERVSLLTNKGDGFNE